MNVVRINSRNVIFILLAIFSTTAKQAHMGYDHGNYSSLKCLYKLFLKILTTNNFDHRECNQICTKRS